MHIQPDDQDGDRRQCIDHHVKGVEQETLSQVRILSVFRDQSDKFCPDLFQDGFFFSQPNSGTEAMAILEYMVNSGLFDIITVDSVAGLTSLEEDKADMGAKVIAGTASLMSNSLKKLVPAIDRTGTTALSFRTLPTNIFLMPPARLAERPTANCKLS